MIRQIQRIDHSLFGSRNGLHSLKIFINNRPLGRQTVLWNQRQMAFTQNSDKVSGSLTVNTGDQRGGYLYS